jgi:glycogen debranching enzyme
MDQKLLTNQIHQILLELATEDGINASGKGDVYGCIFGRDSAITILKILKATQNPQAIKNFDTSALHAICKRALINLVNLQGTQTNIESGEEPGKFIHEYRKNNYERLMTLDVKPWYIYPDKILRNYDSLDSTPLALIAIYKYWQITKDNEFLLQVFPGVEKGLNWIITYGDRDKDQLVEYELPKERNYGGLVVQSWTDSKESMLNERGEFPLYPIAPVEVQGYTWLALKLWADFYADPNVNIAKTESFASKLESQAAQMKEQFNKMFLFEDEGHIFPAQALDGYKNQIRTVTGNPLLLLWAAHKDESILDKKYIDDLVARSFMDDMFVKTAGIRTMSAKSKTYDPTLNSYHNGSFWPKLNGMSHEGLLNFGFEEKANLLKEATLAPIMHFQSPIELYVEDAVAKYLLYKNPQGQESCRQQAWSAAAAFDLLTLS